MKLSNIFNIFRWRNRRGERVESTDANVFIEDTAHPVLDWSESGFRLENYPESPAVGERFAFRFDLPLTSEDVFEFAAWPRLWKTAIADWLCGTCISTKRSRTGCMRYCASYRS